jgi:hypothetical protein
MKHWLALLAFLLVAPLQAWGQAAQVTSGDHPDFTRIVVQFAGPVDWQIGRTPDGYELRLANGAVQYDLTKAFDLIQKDRLAAIWTDPKTGALHLSIACACFAMPFEFRPGTVVVDIRNGKPPTGSAFELPLDGAMVATAEPVEAPPQPPIDPAMAYDWTNMALQPASTGVGMELPRLDQATEKSKSTPMDLEPLRQSLIEQLSRGASAGIVDMAKPKRNATGVVPEDPNPSVEIHNGDTPNMILRQKGDEREPMTADGEMCFTDEQVDVASWSVKPAAKPEGEAASTEAAPGEAPPAKEHAAEAPAKAAEHGAEPAAPESLGGPMEEEVSVSMQFAPAMANLTGEFDRPDPEGIKRAVRFDLYIGFGAETRALLRAFPIENEDIPIWESMARITDEEPDPNPVFAGMEACDTGAALWAVLADPKVLGVGQVQKTAILRAFSTLPAHLRAHFGPTLVDRFLAMEDFATATVLRDAVTRGNPESGPEIEMMQAAIDKASGSPGASLQRLETVAAESGPSNADAMVALILQRAELGQEVSYDQVRAIEEYAKERKGSEDHEKFNQALTLGYAASGDFDNAFANLPNGPDAAGTLWKLLGNAGPDSAILNYATLEEGQEPPRSSRAAASLIADRMLRLGFADQAARWLAVANDPPRLLAARIAIAQELPQQALDLLGDQKTPAAVKVKLDALHQMGDEAGVAALFAELGMTEEHWNAVSRTQDWQTMATDGPDVWKAAAATVADKPASEPAQPAAAGALLPPDGPLAQGQALITESASTRSAISALLDSVKSPAPPSQ